MIVNIKQEKDIINNIISEGIKEILYKGLRIQGNSLGHIEDDCNLLLRALQVKNRIHDFACMLSYNHMFKHYEGKIIYSLINTENLNDAELYEEEINFRF